MLPYTVGHQQNPSEVAAVAEGVINCADYIRLQPGHGRFRADAVVYNSRGKSLADCNFFAIFRQWLQPARAHNLNTIPMLSSHWTPPLRLHHHLLELFSPSSITNVERPPCGQSTSSYQGSYIGQPSHTTSTMYFLSEALPSPLCANCFWSHPLRHLPLQLFPQASKLSSPNVSTAGPLS